MAKIDSVQGIIDNIITAANLTDLPELEMQAMRKKLEEQILRRLGLIIIQNLNKEALAEYEKLMKDNVAPDSAELRKFLEKNLPDYEEKVKKGMAEFLVEIISAFKP